VKAKKRRLIWILVGAAALVRLLALPLPGTVDTKAWKAWTTAATVGGLASVYGPSDTEIGKAEREHGLQGLRGLLSLRPFPRNAFFFRGEFHIVDYPPLSMLLLWSVGRVYSLAFPQMDNGALFNAAISLPPLFASVALTFLLMKTSGGELGRLRGLVFWLNPAVLLGSVLGYQDAVFGLFAVAACLSLMRRRMVLGASLVVLAGLLKPQGSLLLPTLLALLLVEAGLPTLLGAGVAGIVTAACVFAPWWATGHLLSAIDGSRRPLEEITVSAESLNLGWIGGYVLQWIHERPWPLARILTLPEFEAWAGWDAVTVSRILLSGATLLNVVILLRSDREDPVRVPLSLVLQAHLYALFGTSVHENHTFLAVFVAPLLLGVWSKGTAVLSMTSAFLFLNLFLLEGLGRGLIPDRRLYHLRLILGLDLSVVVAVLHVALVIVLFVWALRRPRRAEGLA
jgi:hypothetical protein